MLPKILNLYNKGLNRTSQEQSITKLQINPRHVIKPPNISFCFTGKCIALRFNNRVGHPVKLISHVKPTGWLVSGEEFKIRLTFKNPDLHKFITFKAEDLYGQLILHLDGDKTISVMPRTDCSEYIDVQITGVPGELTTKPL